MIKIQKTKNCGLIKEEWQFEIINENLTYTAHYTYTRKTKNEKWADEKPPQLTYEQYCKKYKHDENSPQTEEKYEKYYKKTNPILQKRLKGQYFSINNITKAPKCPTQIAKQAKAKFIKNLKTIYKPNHNLKTNQNRQK